MELDEVASKVIWNNPPPNRDAERVMILYDLGGRTGYTIVAFPEFSPPTDSRKHKVPNE
jgi:hypothetical protein